MSAQIKEIADVVRQAKLVIDAAAIAAQQLNDSAQRVAATTGQVNDMVHQLDQLDADLIAAIGMMSSTAAAAGVAAATITATTPAAETIESSIVKVEAANAAAALATQ